jgi:hypothetical protein
LSRLSASGWVSLRYCTIAPAARTERLLAFNPNPSSVDALNCVNKTHRICPVRISMRVGRGVTLMPSGKGLIIGVEDFSGVQARQLGAQGFERQFGDGEFSSGDVGIGNRGSLSVGGGEIDRGEVVVRIPGQESRFGHRPRSDHAHDLAFDQSLGGRGRRSVRRWRRDSLFRSGARDNFRRRDRECPPAGRAPPPTGREVSTMSSSRAVISASSSKVS